MISKDYVQVYFLIATRPALAKFIRDLAPFLLVVPPMKITVSIFCRRKYGNPPVVLIRT
jgi:hypothetical protein